MQETLFSKVSLVRNIPVMYLKNYLQSKGIIHSFSREGNLYDNAYMKFFHFILKEEKVNHHKYHNF